MTAYATKYRRFPTTRIAKGHVHSINKGGEDEGVKVTWRAWRLALDYLLSDLFALDT